MPWKPRSEEVGVGGTMEWNSYLRLSRVEYSMPTWWIILTPCCWAMVRPWNYFRNGFTRGAVTGVADIEVSNYHAFSGVRKGDLRRGALRKIRKMDTFVLGNVSYIGVAMIRRGPGSAAAREA